MPEPTIALRSATQRDLAWLQRLAAEDSVAMMLAVDAVDRLPGALARGELVVSVAAGEPVGAAQLAVRNRRSRIVELQPVMLEPTRRGRGLGVATVRAVGTEVLQRRGMHRLEAEVYGFNHDALRTFARAGFVREGVRRQAYERHGARHDGVLFGLLVTDLY